MRKRRKTPSRQELARLARRKRVADAWMAGASAAAIAKSERISTAAVYTDLQAAQDVILPGATREMLLAKNYERLEAVIRANADGVKDGDDAATRNSVRALEAQNRMLGVAPGAINNFTINAGGGSGDALPRNITVEFPTIVTRPDGTTWEQGKVLDDPPPAARPYSAYPQPKLIEYKPASDPVPLAPDAMPRRPEPPPSDGLRKMNQGGSLLRFSEYETELDIPRDKRPPTSIRQPITGRPRNWQAR